MSKFHIYEPGWYQMRCGGKVKITTVTPHTVSDGVFNWEPNGSSGLDAMTYDLIAKMPDDHNEPSDAQLEAMMSAANIVIVAAAASQYDDGWKTTPSEVQRNSLRAAFIAANLTRRSAPEKPWCNAARECDPDMGTCACHNEIQQARTVNRTNQELPENSDNYIKLHTAYHDSLYERDILQQELDKLKSGPFLVTGPSMNDMIADMIYTDTKDVTAAINTLDSHGDTRTVWQRLDVYTAHVTVKKT